MPKPFTPLSAVGATHACCAAVLGAATGVARQLCAPAASAFLKRQPLHRFALSPAQCLRPCSLETPAGQPGTPPPQVVLTSDGSGGAPAPAVARITRLLLAAGADPLGHSSRRRCSTLRCACGSEFLPNRTLPLLLDHLEGRMRVGRLVSSCHGFVPCLWLFQRQKCVKVPPKHIAACSRHTARRQTGSVEPRLKALAHLLACGNVTAADHLRGVCSSGRPTFAGAAVHAGLWQRRRGDRGDGGSGALLPSSTLPGGRGVGLLHGAKPPVDGVTAGLDL